MTSPARPRTSPDSPDPVRRAVRRAPWPLLLLLAAPAPAAGQWPPSPSVNLPVCTAPRAQYFRQAVSDGEGGMIVAWSDERADTADVYVQRVSASGQALWTAQGVRLCGAPWAQDDVTLAPDGAGGAFVAWSDRRRRWESDLYAQRVDASGQALWVADGVPVCTMPGDQLAPQLVPDGWGVLVVWEDRRVTSGVFAQRLSASGTRVWDTTGVSLSSTPPPRFEPVAAPDGLGGAIVAWTQQGSNGLDVVAQRIDGAGSLRWGPSGRLVAGGPGEQVAPAIVSTQDYRVVIAWEDAVAGASTIRARDLDIDGVSQFAGAPVALSLTARMGRRPALAPDGGGGAIAVWHETLPGFESVRAQRVSAAGTARWTSGGARVAAAGGIQQFASVVADGRAGAMIAWEDLRSGIWDIYAQRMDSSGTARWGAGGLVVSDAAGSQLGPRIVANGDTLAIVVWTDQRAGGTDLYAQRIPFAVTLGAPAAVPTGLRLRAAPNPAGGPMRVAFTLPSAAEVSVRIHDAAGRLVRELRPGRMPAGAVEIVWDGREASGRLAPPGLYLARLRAGSREGRITLVRSR